MMIPDETFTFVFANNSRIIIRIRHRICKDRRQFRRESVSIPFVLPTSQPLICSPRPPLNFELS